MPAHAVATQFETSTDGRRAHRASGPFGAIAPAVRHTATLASSTSAMAVRISSRDNTLTQPPRAADRVLRASILLLGVAVIVGMLGFAAYVSTQ